MVGFIKGYEMINISKKKAEKEEVLDELILICPTIREDIEKAIDSGGRVYGLKKKNVIKAAYLFDGVSKGRMPELKYASSYYTCDAADRIDKFEKSIMGEISDLVNIGMYVKAQWNDDSITADPLSGGRFSAPVFLISTLIGLLLGIAYKNIVIGLCMGCGFGLSLGTVLAKKK